MKLYLAGPMSGLPDFNYPAFHDAREKLRKAGHEVICPAEYTIQQGIDNTNLPYGFLTNQMRFCIKSVLEVDAVAMLPYWARSLGARTEALVAVSIGIPIYAYDKHNPELLELLPNVDVITRVEMIAKK